MRKTVQEWLDANHHSNGPAKKKIAGLRRLQRISAKLTTIVDGPAAIKRRAKKNRGSVKGRRPK